LKNYVILKYTGEWYEVQKFRQVNEDNLKCFKAVYTTINTATIKVNNSGINMYEHFYANFKEYFLEIFCFILETMENMRK
jgi:lipocalin